MIRPAALFPVLLVLLWPGICAGAKGEGSYFPLKPGLAWKSTVISDKRETRKLTVSNLAPRDINGTSATPRKFASEGPATIIYVAEDDSGVYRLAEQQAESTEPTMTKPRVYYFKYPLHVRESWEIHTELGKSGIKMKIDLTLEALNDNVKVPAGSFSNCLKIKHTGMSVSGVENGTTVAIEAYEWFAPGVGWVKSMLSVKKKHKDGVTFSENTIYQLESFKH